jgi:hypothetical protein
VDIGYRYHDGDQKAVLVYNHMAFDAFDFFVK